VLTAVHGLLIPIICYCTSFGLPFSFFLLPFTVGNLISPGSVSPSLQKRLGNFFLPCRQLCIVCSQNTFPRVIRTTIPSQVNWQRFLRLFLIFIPSARPSSVCPTFL
jgi:hypothetical protein